MNDSGWRRNKYGGLFNINDYMNQKIRKQTYKNYEGDGERADEESFKQDNPEVVYEKNVKTYEQQRVIEEYTTDVGYASSRSINKFLNDDSTYSDSQKQTLKQNVQILESCMQNSCSVNFECYRGFKGIKAKDLKIGDEIGKNSIKSCSLTTYEPSHHAINGTMVKIKIQKGTKMLYIGSSTKYKRNEYELLLPSKTKIVVTKINKLFDEDGDFMNYEVEAKAIQ